MVSPRSFLSSSTPRPSIRLLRTGLCHPVGRDTLGKARFSAAWNLARNPPTKGRAGGKQPIGNRASRSPPQSFSAAERNAPTKSR
jgi:hypothetical protein